jgi:GLPGLI family protein
MNTIKLTGFFILLLGFVFCFHTVNAQPDIIQAGFVEYEKKVNMHKWMEDNSWTRELKDRLPVYRTTYFNLRFDSARAVYKVGKEPAEDRWKNMWMQPNQEDNVTIQHFEKATYTAIKQVFEKKYLVQDSLIPIVWRITDETRTIAGFDCRKAVGKLYDSLYVVAFYTDQIALPAGPEIYHGLPGLILGLAFPRYYTTWFATRVELTIPKQSEFEISAGKSTKTTQAELMRTVKEVVQRWGTEEEKQRYFWSIVL